VYISKTLSKASILSVYFQAAVVALEPVTTEGEVISFWKPNMTITLIDDYTRYVGFERHGIHTH
jgi:hypothetical protein